MQLNRTPSESKRPLTVVIAVVCVAIALAGAPLSWIFTLHWRKPIAVLIFVGICLALFRLVRALYLRREWARWLIIIWTVVGLFGIPRLLREFTFSIPMVRSLAQIILYVIATILLLCPPSRRWFAGDSNVA